MHTKPHGHKSVFRRFGQLLLLLLCLFVVIAIFRLLLSLFPAQESNVQVTSPPDLTGLVEMQLSLSENEQLNAVNLTIDRIAIADTHRDFSDEDLVCLRELSLYSGLYQLTYAAVFAPAQPTGKEQTTPVGWRPVEYYQTPYPLENLCISPSNINDMFSYLGNNIVEISPSGAVTLVARSPEIDGWLSPIQVYETRSAFYYPYDNRSVFFGMTGVLEATKTLDEEGTTSFSSAPILSLNVTTPNWLTEIEILDQQLSSAGSDQRYFFINDNTEQGGLAFDSVPATMVYITQQRPLAQQVLTGVLLVSVFIFIGALLFVSETGAFLEIAIGILLGLWGIQDILIPDYVTEPTFIHSLILIFYVLLAFVTAINFVIRPLWRRLGSTGTVSLPEPEQGTCQLQPLPTTQAFPVIANRKGDFLQWVTAVSATITAITTLLHLINRNKNQN